VPIGITPRPESAEMEIVPAVICVMPVYELAPDSVKVELPVLFVILPAPETSPESVCVAEDAYVNVLPEPIEIAPE